MIYLVTLQEDVEQNKDGLRIVKWDEHLDDWQTNYVKELNKHYLSALKAIKIDSIISLYKEREMEALKSDPLKDRK
jgi:hypothetical protein